MSVSCKNAVTELREVKTQPGANIQTNEYIGIISVFEEVRVMSCSNLHGWKYLCQSRETNTQEWWIHPRHQDGYSEFLRLQTSFHREENSQDKALRRKMVTENLPSLLIKELKFALQWQQVMGVMVHNVKPTFGWSLSIIIVLSWVQLFCFLPNFLQVHSGKQQVTTRIGRSQLLMWEIKWVPDPWL